MAYNNSIVVRGNLCADCEVHDNRVDFRIAVNVSKEKSIYLRVKLFTDNIDMLNKCFDALVRGVAVEVRGALDVYEFESADGAKHTIVGIIASDIIRIEGLYLPIKNKPAEDKPAGRSRNLTACGPDGGDDIPF